MLPPGLVASSPEYLRPSSASQPRGGHFLHFCAFDLGRGPDGDWWVLGDRTQAPSGAGFALENRVATTRALPTSTARCMSHRLAGFFRDFRDALPGIADEPGGRVAILTPGPLNETYYEHAYIARYLGIMLLEGEDLTVTDGRLMVRTVSGLKPVSVLWRRLDAAFADPLELDGYLAHRHAGPVGAIRQGSVTVVNALGSGILETRALLAFLPRIARAMLGEPLMLPTIATWWCGGARRARACAPKLDRMMIGPALSTRLPFERRADRARRPVPRRRPREHRRLARVRWRPPRRPGGGDAVDHAGLVDGRLSPRPMSLRVYLARTPNGWIVMPGGFARIGCTLDTTAIAMQRGGQAADVWIVSDTPVEPETMLPAPRGADSRRPAGHAADPRRRQPLWLGRYVERAEDTVRILRAYHVRLAETSDRKCRCSSISRSISAIGIDADEPVPAGLRAILRSAIYSAGQIRDRFSPDGWLALAISPAPPAGCPRPWSPATTRARDDRAPAQDRRLFRPRAREHVPLHRLAFPGDRPPLERALAMIAALRRWRRPTRPTERST